MSAASMMATTSGYLVAGASVVGWLAERSTSAPVGALAGCCGRAGAAPVVTPGSALVRGVTSRMPGGAPGGLLCAVFCVAGAVAVEPVPAGFIDELLRP